MNHMSLHTSRVPTESERVGTSRHECHKSCGFTQLTRSDRVGTSRKVSDCIECVAALSEQLHCGCDRFGRGAADRFGARVKYKCAGRIWSGARSGGRHRFGSGGCDRFGSGAADSDCIGMRELKSHGGERLDH